MSESIVRAHEIGLGDLAHTFYRLCPQDPQTRRQIAALLGLVSVEARVKDEPDDASPPDPVPPPGTGGVTGPTTPDPGSEPAEPDAGPTPEQPQDRHSVRSILESLEPAPSVQPPLWLDDVSPLRSDPADRTRPEIDRLFTPRWIRGILTTTLCAPAADGPVDADALVDIIANARPVEAFPLEVIPTLRNGVQLLIDVGDGLAPFSRDQQLLTADIMNVVSADHLRIGWFEGCPTRGVFYDDAEEESPFQAPLAGAAVLLLTDIGVGRPLLSSQAAGVAEWRDFLRLVREAGCTALAFVPYEPRRWPRALQRELRIVHWDRHTAAGGLGPPRAVRRSRSSDSFAQPSLRRLARRNPDAVALAKAVALAARVEPELLRAARLKLLPDADAGVEADLWFSPVVRARSRGALLFLPAAVADLRRALRADGEEQIERCWHFLQAYRAATGAPYAIRQEEEINYLALRYDDGGRDRVVRLLREALKALIEGDGEQEDIARWALRAVPALPVGVRDLPEARQLYYAANLRLTTRPVPEDYLPADAKEARWLLPTEPPTVSIGVRLVGDGVEFSYTPQAGMHQLEVPRTDPRILEISWPGREDDVPHPISISLSPGQTVAVKTDAQPVTIQTVYGQRYAVRPDARRLAFVEPVDFSEFLDPSRIPGDLVGEERVWARVTDWLQNRSRPRALLVFGEPGSGKSTLAMRLAQISQQAGPPVPIEDRPRLGPQFLSAVHFCIAGDRRSLDPLAFVESIAAQLGNFYVGFADALQDLAQRAGRPLLPVTATATPSYQGPVEKVEQSAVSGSSFFPGDLPADTLTVRVNVEQMEPPDAFRLYLAEPLARLYEGGFEEQIIILVDALDESANVPQDECIRTLLERAEDLPPGVRFIVTSRPTSDVMETSKRLKAVTLELTVSGLRLTEEQRQRVGDVFLDAYDRPSLERMLATQLERRVEFESLSDVVVIAEREGWLEALIRGAYRDRPENRNLRGLVQELFPEDFATGAGSAKVRVCVDRVLSGELLEQARRRSIALNPANDLSRLPSEYSNGVKWYWSPGQTLRVRFLDGDPAVQHRVQRYAHRWSEYADLEFDFGDHPEAEIRISFKLKGVSWSWVGTQALAITDRYEPTMNLGWLEPDSPDVDYSSVVLHEFGHALGCIHEHQSPSAGIPWDQDAVYAFYMGPPNYWTREQVADNILSKYSRSQTQFDTFDTRSVMLYPIPDAHTLGEWSIEWANADLSETDKEFISRVYPYQRAM